MLNQYIVARLLVVVSGFYIFSKFKVFAIFFKFSLLFWVDIYLLSPCFSCFFYRLLAPTYAL
jgi:hypothetical protein